MLGRCPENAGIDRTGDRTLHLAAEMRDVQAERKVVSGQEKDGLHLYARHSRGSHPLMSNRRQWAPPRSCMTEQSLVRYIDKYLSDSQAFLIE